MRTRLDRRCLPPGVEPLHASDPVVLVAVMRLRRPTYGSLVRATGLSQRPLFQALHRLRDAGFVDFVDGSHGTLHALVREVPFGIGWDQ